MSFFYLFLAGICETCWPFGFKMAQTSDSRDGWIAFSLLTMTLSVVFFMRHKNIYLWQPLIRFGPASARWALF